MATIPDPLAKAVREALDRREWSVTELAGRAGLTRPAVSKWLTGRRQLGARSVCKLLDALGVLKPVVNAIKNPPH